MKGNSQQKVVMEWLEAPVVVGVRRTWHIVEISLGTVREIVEKKLDVGMRRSCHISKSVIPFLGYPR